LPVDLRDEVGQPVDPLEEGLVEGEPAGEPELDHPLQHVGEGPRDRRPHGEQFDDDQLSDGGGVAGCGSFEQIAGPDGRSENRPPSQ
jgi:hypothetical protein